MRLTGVIKNGRKVYDDPAMALVAPKSIGEGERFVETLEKQTQRRSNAANSRYWAAIVPVYRYLINEELKGQGIEVTKEEVHEQLVRRFAGVVETSIGPVRKSTSSMTTKEFYEFTERCAAHLAELGYFVPELGETA